MSYEWDPTKAHRNRRKHGIHFADAVAVFEDDHAITVADPSVKEERWLTIGQDFLGRVLVAVYTYRGSTIRLISARKATAAERAHYERG